ncbi:MAG: hypothetical protein CL920_32130 [Deltaproteobacteria bacterium]|nr:hypothetical protein [Deltaproteobacteria bacterium]MBU53370.1 hypothetical protein [Deltaproteobacteria bacterium]|tara:strand:- start:676 stop:1134 length:459 start_codon:yes stop_codon:yes gene_type:complete
MFKKFWQFFLRLIGWGRSKPGTGNSKVHELSHLNQSGWVKDVTGVVVWIKEVDEAERKERRRRFFRHMWRTIKEWFGAKADHKDRYPHQIFLIEVENCDDLTVRVENNLYTGKELRGIKKGMRVEVGGEYLPNNKGGKLHHTHGKNGYLWKR